MRFDKNPNISYILLRGSYSKAKKWAVYFSGLCISSEIAVFSWSRGIEYKNLAGMIVLWISNSKCQHRRSDMVDSSKHAGSNYPHSFWFV